MSTRYPAESLQQFAAELLGAAGLSAERSAIVARGFLEADLMGFTTHGLARIPANVRWLRSGAISAAGDPVVLRQAPSAASWDGAFLPGPYVMHLAVAHALEQARRQGVYVLTLRRAAHIACLASYLVPVVEQGLVGLIMTSTPGEAFVSPFAGVTPLFSNNPIAFGAPGRQHPLLFDISTAITAGGQVARAAKESKLMPEACLKDSAGQISNDPAVLGQGGSVMPIGGVGHGHKGYALTLMTETLTQILPGYGNLSGAADGEANSVFLQILDPAAFSEPDQYADEMAQLILRIKGSRADTADGEVRVPGERAWRLRSQRLLDGVDLYPGVFTALTDQAEQLGVEVPDRLQL